MLGPFLAEHWKLPVPAQGAPPAHFEAGEASLDPALCGACHPAQYREWSSSLHARAYSPGLAAQLAEGPLATPDEVRACLTCHAPLAEQQPWRPDGSANPRFDESLLATGVSCAGCHVRAHRRLGPAPMRPLSPPETHASGRRTHDGFEVREEFEQSRFCAPCHQFFDDAGVNGKPLENSYREWQEWAASDPSAAQSCQDCHMPARSHRWLGIHDRDFVRSSVAAELFVQPSVSSGRVPEVEAALVLQSRGVGHAFPTYLTPSVSLAIWQADARGRVLAGTRSEGAIERVVDLTAEPAVEISDSRVAPGESVKLEYRSRRHPGAAILVGEVRVDPDAHYRRVYAALRSSLESPRARELLDEAEQRIRTSAYRLFRFERALPPR